MTKLHSVALLFISAGLSSAQVSTFTGIAYSIPGVACFNAGSIGGACAYIGLTNSGGTANPFLNGSSPGNQLFSLGTGTYNLFSNPLYSPGDTVNLIFQFSDKAPAIITFTWPDPAIAGTILYSQTGADAFTLSTTGITNADRMSFGNGGGDTPFHPDGTNDVVLQLRVGPPVTMPTPNPLAGRLATSQDHSLAAKFDGSVWGWGENVSGVLGDGTTISRSTPVQAVGVVGATGVAGRWQHSLAVLADGTVWSWGANDEGELGDGTMNSRPTPLPVPGLTGIIAVAAGQFHSLALKNDGTVWAWGFNVNGQLGDGTSTTRLTPVQVIGLTGVIAVAAGQQHSMVLKNDGTVWTWGYNNDGELGNGSFNTAVLTAVQVTGLTGVMSIAAGLQHSLALKSDGTVWTWGRGDSGQLGNGSAASQSSIVNASGLTGIIAIAGGSYHSLAVKNDGTVWAWGDNGNGELGDGTNSQRNTPVIVNGLSTGFFVTAGIDHSLAVQTDGSIWGWGRNSIGQFGAAGPASSSVPVLSLLRFFTLAAPPIVAIDAPVAGAIISGTVTVSGWALDSASTGTAIGSVVVKVDGTTLGSATYGSNRADVCGSLPGRPGCPNVGYTFALNTSALSPGVHTITVTAADTDGTPEIGSASVTVTVPGGGPPLVNIDSPFAGSTVYGTVAFTGWAIDSASTGTAIGSVVVKLDGATLGNATYGVRRDDVCTARPGRPGCPNVGFTFSVNTSALSAGSHTITVIATDTDAVPDAGEASILVTVIHPTFPPLVNIDSPLEGSTVSGTVAFSGWAIDNDPSGGTKIGSVVVKVDGTTVGNATYGSNRADVCAARGGGPGCPNVGFTFALNTSALSAGSHTITVFATDTDGVPETGGALVKVTVLNPISPPLVNIDSPLAGSTVSGTVAFTGWAIDNDASGGTKISSVVVKLDGATLGNAAYGFRRDDVCTALPGRPGCPNVGFAFNVTFSALSAGSHTISVTAIDTDGVPDAGSASVTVTVLNPTSPPLVFIDAPIAGSTISGTVAVTGWAIDNATTVGTAFGSLVVKVDGTTAGNATMGASRPDVCAALPGRPGCPNVGYLFMLDTSRLAPGAHTITVSATDTDATPDTGTATVMVTVGSSPLVFIEAPLGGSVLSGTVTVSGWAIDNFFTVGTAIGSVVVKVDGVVAGNATYGASRPDVCSALPGRPGCPNVGFTFALNTSGLSAGAHTITVSAADTDTSPDITSASVNVTVAVPPLVYVDSPSPGAVVAGTVTVSGWAIDNTASISALQVKVDGVAVGSATYGTARPDVCVGLPGRPGCPNVGFTFALNTGGLAPGLHMLTVTATDSDSTPDARTWTVAFQVAILPTVFIDAPLQGSTVAGTVTVSGWAIDNASIVGTAISAVQVKVDGVLAGTATYGINRPDVCGAFPGRPGCPNVGFTFALNTASLSTGSHTITVSATDSDGAPDVGSATIMVMR